MQELSKTCRFIFSLPAKKPMQHNLSSKLGTQLQLQQVHRAATSPTSPFSSSLLASSMSSYLKPDSVAIESSRNGSRPSHYQGWSRKLSCNILRNCKVQEQTIMKWNSVFVCSAAIHFQGPEAISHLHEKVSFQLCTTFSPMRIPEAHFFDPFPELSLKKSGPGKLWVKKFGPIMFLLIFGLFMCWPAIFHECQHFHFLLFA